MAMNVDAMKNFSKMTEEERNRLLFTHKLDTCCQAMCQECKTSKNPAFRRRRIINRLDSVTVCTIGVNSNRNRFMEESRQVKSKSEMNQLVERLGKNMF